MRTFIALAASAAILAGCSGGDADSDGERALSREEMQAEMSENGKVAMRPGQWEQTIEFTEFNVPGLSREMADMAKRNMGNAVTVRHCLTREDVDKPDANFFGGDQSKDCDYEEFDRSGDRMTIAMTCKTGQGGTARTRMEGKFGEDSYTLSMDNRIGGMPMGEMTMKGTVTGRRVGDCPAATETK